MKRYDVAIAIIIMNMKKNMKKNMATISSMIRTPLLRLHTHEKAGLDHCWPTLATFILPYN